MIKQQMGDTNDTRTSLITRWRDDTGIYLACFTLPHALFCVYAHRRESAIVRHG